MPRSESARHFTLPRLEISPQRGHRDKKNLASKGPEQIKIFRNMAGWIRPYRAFCKKGTLNRTLIWANVTKLCVHSVLCGDLFFTGAGVGTGMVC